MKLRSSAHGFEISSRRLFIPDTRIRGEARLGHFVLAVVWLILVHRTVRFKSAEDGVKETSLATCPFSSDGLPFACQLDLLSSYLCL